MEIRIQECVVGFSVIVVLSVIVVSITRGRVQPEKPAVWIQGGKPMTVIDQRSRGEY
jgi:hypothetical protein